MKIVILPKSYQQRYFKEITQTVSDFFNKSALNPEGVINLHFVSDSKIQKLNAKYRHIDTPTDVLSFPIWPDLKKIPKNGPYILGDIFICLKYLKIKKTDFQEAIRHSLDHLVGKHH